MIFLQFAIKSVMSSIGRSFEEGCELEQQFAVYLFTSGQSRALQYAFLSQRKATQVMKVFNYNFNFKIRNRVIFRSLNHSSSDFIR